jgi:hypothetical protein
VWFKRKNDVLCSKCGFLGWQTQDIDGSITSDLLSECYWRVRRDFQSGTFSGITEENFETHDSNIFSCRASQWSLVPRIVNLEKGWLSADLIRQPRKCLYYIDYHAGFSPDEHKELKRDKLTRQAMFKASLVGALIGSIAAILAALISVLVFVFTRN